MVELSQRESNGTLTDNETRNPAYASVPLSRLKIFDANAANVSRRVSQVTKVTKETLQGHSGGRRKSQIKSIGRRNTYVKVGNVLEGLEKSEIAKNSSRKIETKKPKPPKAFDDKMNSIAKRLEAQLSGKRMHESFLLILIHAHRPSA